MDEFTFFNVNFELSCSNPIENTCKLTAQNSWYWSCCSTSQCTIISKQGELKKWRSSKNNQLKLQKVADLESSLGEPHNRSNVVQIFYCWRLLTAVSLQKYNLNQCITTPIVNLRLLVFFTFTYVMSMTISVRVLFR